MKRLLSLFLAATAGVWFPAGASAGDLARPNTPNRLPSTNELAEIRQAVETLRGKKFKFDVPVRSVGEKELRELVNREIDKEYPGRKLDDLQELMVWLDVLPAKTDLRKVVADLMVDQVAAFYDSDTKEMCVYENQSTNHPSLNKLKAEDVSGLGTAVVLAHEYTHALEDQYWPLDEPKETKSKDSMDRSEARSYLFEGSATRLMVEAVPTQTDARQPFGYIFTWKLIHSGVGEMALDYGLGQVWKSPDAMTPGVPEVFARSEAMPYAFGYRFTADIERKWGLDGLDYVCDHPPVDTEQVLHPEKSWEWRDFPVQVTLPETLPGGWKRVTEDTIGEASMGLLLGCQSGKLERGMRLAEGWDGDRVGLYEDAQGGRLLVWASSWDSASGASRFGSAWAQQQCSSHQAVLTKQTDGFLSWTRPDGRVGSAWRGGKHLLLVETDKPEALKGVGDWASSVSYTEPPQDAERAAANDACLRFNPVISYREDGDYAVMSALAGLLWRHDDNCVGSADRVLLGLAGESRRTDSFNKWKLVWGLLARHQSEARRGVAETTLLPWGMLYSHFSSPLPSASTNTIGRDSVLWGLVGSRTVGKDGRYAVKLLPAGLLFRSAGGPGEKSLHILGTGYSRQDAVTRIRVFGITVYTKTMAQQAAAKKTDATRIARIGTNSLTTDEH